jgi:putative lipoic acid-binding regulatory protein
MKITEVRLDRTFNMGNYQSVRVGFTASVDEDQGDNVQKALDILDREAHEFRNSLET